MLVDVVNLPVTACVDASSWKSWTTCVTRQILSHTISSDKDTSKKQNWEKSMRGKKSRYQRFVSTTCKTIPFQVVVSAVHLTFIWTKSGAMDSHWFVLPSFFFLFVFLPCLCCHRLLTAMSLKAMTDGSTLANYRSPFLDNVLQHANGRNIDPSRSKADKSVCTFEHFSPGSSEQEGNRHRMDIKLHWGGDLGKASLSHCFLWFSVLVERSSKYLRLETDGKLTDLVLQDYPEC